jgi:N6-L-threonylcarbamoyladenine synthase
MSDTIILGIETSCDETAAALVRNGRDILSNVVYSQIAVHQPFGGVVPEVASRKHIEHIAGVVREALVQAEMSPEAIDAVAVTNRPGLIGALLVGVSFAQALAYALHKPLLALNHLEGHLYANYLEQADIPLPAVGLVVSGGHTSLLAIREMGQYAILGETIDDAVGEAFDKIARFLGLGYPGGPLIEQAARAGTLGRFNLPQIFPQSPYDFSFSGLKTAVMNNWNQAQQSARLTGANPPRIEDMAAEFQAAATETLIKKTLRAAREHQAHSVLLAGGVAANTYLRTRMAAALRQELNLPLFVPRPALCTDNAAMIAGLGYHYFRQQAWAGWEVGAQARADFLH